MFYYYYDYDDDYYYYYYYSTVEYEIYIELRSYTDCKSGALDSSGLGYKRLP